VRRDTGTFNIEHSTLNAQGMGIMGGRGVRGDACGGKRVLALNVLQPASRGRIGGGAVCYLVALPIVTLLRLGTAALRGRGVWARGFRHLTLRSVTGTAQRAIPTRWRGV